VFSKSRVIRLAANNLINIVHYFVLVCVIKYLLKYTDGISWINDCHSVGRPYRDGDSPVFLAARTQKVTAVRGGISTPNETLLSDDQSLSARDITKRSRGISREPWFHNLGICSGSVGRSRGLTIRTDEWLIEMSRRHDYADVDLLWFTTVRSVDD